VAGFRSSAGTILFMERSTEGSTPPEVPGVQIRRATPADAEAYARDVGTDSRTTFVGRLGKGTECYLALEGDVIVHASWVTTRAAWVGELGRYFTPSPSSAYVYESFTTPSARGRGIYPAVLEHIAGTLSQSGIDRLWIGVGADNVPSIRAIEKGGFVPAFEVGFEIRWGRIDIPTVSGPRSNEAEALVRERSPSSP
jgi:GNAT superfamily N-acetyltransferase